jgi:hypothetical protein
MIENTVVIWYIDRNFSFHLIFSAKFQKNHVLRYKDGTCDERQTFIHYFCHFGVSNTKVEKSTNA